MPAQWIPSAWKALVARGGASGHPPGGYLTHRSADRHADCSSVVGEAICNDLMEKTAERLAERAAPIDSRVVVTRAASASQVVDGFTEGWQRIGKALFSKSVNGRVADIAQAAPGRWIMRLRNRRGRVKVGSGIPVSGADLISIITLADKYLNFGGQVLAQERIPKYDTQKLINGEFPNEIGGNNVQTKRAGLKILIDRILNAQASVPPVPTPAPMPTPDSIPAPVDRSIQYMAAENRSESIYAQAFHAAKRAVEPLAVDIANMAAGRPQDVRASDRVALVNRSIRENGGIRPDGKVSPGVAARRFLGLPFTGSSPAYVDKSGSAAVGVHDPRARHENISVMVRRSRGLSGDGRQPDSRSKFPSRYMPEIVFKSAAARNQYDEQLSGNAHDGSVIVRAAQVNVVG